MDPPKDGTARLLINQTIRQVNLLTNQSVKVVDYSTSKSARKSADALTVVTLTLSWYGECIPVHWVET